MTVNPLYSNGTAGAHSPGTGITGSEIQTLLHCTTTSVKSECWLSKYNLQLCLHTNSLIKSVRRNAETNEFKKI